MTAGRSGVVFLAALAVSTAAATARAQDAPDDLGWGYLVDGGALPFFWGSAAVAVASFTLLEPPEEPRLFPPSEGGVPASGETIPDYQVGIAVAATPLLLAIPDTDARLYHAKGAAEAIVTTAAFTELVKNIFGRRRPIYADGSTNVDDRKSFFSGHSSLTLAATTYTGVYLHHHVFARWRDEDQLFAWWEVGPAAALVAVSIYVPYTRIDEGHHHTSDVVAGAGLGVLMAGGFYLYQELRLRSALAGSAEDIALIPSPSGISVLGRW